MHPEKCVNQATVRNAVLNAAGESFWGLQTALVSSATVLTVLLTRLGSGPLLISSISAIEAGGIVIPQIFGVYIFGSAAQRKKRIILWHWFVMIPFLFFMGLLVCCGSSVPKLFERWALLFFFGCFNVSIGIVSAIWMDWLAHLYDTKSRGTVMGIGFGCSATTGIFGGLLAGKIIRGFHDTSEYGYLYLAAGLIAFLSISLFWFINDSAIKTEPNDPAPQLRALINDFNESLRHANFRAFLVGRLLATAGFCILPFVTVYYTSATGGGLSDGAVVSCGSAQAAGFALANILLGRLGDRFGHRVGLMIGAGMQVVTMGIVLTGAGTIRCVCAFASVGVCISAGLVSHYNMLFETCPHANRTAHIAAGNFIIGLGVIVFPVLAGLTIARWGLPVVFTISAIISAGALVWFMFFVKEPRRSQNNNFAVT